MSPLNDGAPQGSSNKNNAAAANATTPAPLSAAPLGQRPTLRMQDGDIILEDGALRAGGLLASSPFASNTQKNDNSLGKSPVTPLPPLPPGTAPAAAAGGGDIHNNTNNNAHTPMMMVHSSQITVNSLQAQPSRPATFAGGGSGAPTPTPPEPARSATGAGVGSFRLHFDVVESVRGAKYRTTELTASNVQQLTKQQYGGESSKTSTTERMWRWLADAGPPYEVNPSIGVSSKPPLHQTNGNSGIKLFACFKCFS
jgi:hypothetical protein